MEVQNILDGRTCVKEAALVSILSGVLLRDNINRVCINRYLHVLHVSQPRKRRDTIGVVRGLSLVQRHQGFKLENTCLSREFYFGWILGEAR